MASILELCASEFTYTRFVRPIAHCLSSHGHNISVCYGSEDATSTYSHVHNYFPLCIPRSFDFLTFVKAAFSLKRICRSQTIDFVHCHTPSASLVARLSRLFGNKSKIVYTVHGFYFHENMHPLPYVMHFFIEFFLSIITYKISCVSAEDYRVVTRFFPIASSRVLYIPNSVDAEKFFTGDVLSSAIEPSSCIRLGFAGRLVREKGIHELLMSVFILMSVNPSVSLDICGEHLSSDRDPVDPGLFEAFSTAFPDKFRTLGMLAPDDMPSFYRSIDYLVLPSYREGLPTVLIEAMMMGVPCMASSIRGCRELLFGSSSSFLFRPHNVRSLLRCLLNTLSFHPEYASLSSSAFSSVNPCYTSASVLPSYLFLFR